MFPYYHHGTALSLKSRSGQKGHQTVVVVRKNDRTSSLFRKHEVGCRIEKDKKIDR